MMKHPEPASPVTIGHLPRVSMPAGMSALFGHSTAILDAAVALRPFYDRNLNKKVVAMSTPYLSMASATAAAPIFGSFMPPGDGHFLAVHHRRDVFHDNNCISTSFNPTTMLYCYSTP